MKLKKMKTAITIIALILILTFSCNLSMDTASYDDKLSVVNKQLVIETKRALKQREIYNTNVGKAADNAKSKLFEIETEIASINRIKSAIEAERDADKTIN